MTTAKDGRKGGSIDPRPSQAIFDMISKAQLAWLGSGGDGAKTAYEAWSDAVTEAADFAAARLHREVEMQYALLHCGSVPEFQAIQTQFFQRMIDDYQAELGRLVSLMQKVLPKAAPIIS